MRAVRVVCWVRRLCVRTHGHRPPAPASSGVSVDYSRLPPGCLQAASLDALVAAEGGLLECQVAEVAEAAQPDPSTGRVDLGRGRGRGQGLGRGQPTN